jgi:hypothetical protein
MKIHHADLRNIPFIDAIASRTSNVSITSGSETNLVWQQVDRDTGGFFDLGSDNDSILIPSGIERVDIMASVRWAAVSGGNREIRILKNGSAMSPIRRTITQATLGTNIQTQCIAYGISITSSDTIEIAVFQNQGGAVNVLGTSEDTWVHVRATYAAVP